MSAGLPQSLSRLWLALGLMLAVQACSPVPELLRRADGLVAKGEYSEAFKLYAQADKHENDTNQALLRAGDLNLKLKRNDLALKAFEQAL